MNKVIVREYVKDVFGFELEKQEENKTIKKGASSQTNPDEPPSVVVFCESEKVRDEWLKLINDQIRKLNEMAKRLENPKDLSFL